MSVSSKRFAFFALLTSLSACAQGYGQFDGEPVADAGALVDGHVAAGPDFEPGHEVEAGAALFAEGVVPSTPHNSVPAPAAVDVDAALVVASQGAADAGSAQGLADTGAQAPVAPASTSAADSAAEPSGTPTGSPATSTPAVAPAGTSRPPATTTQPATAAPSSAPSTPSGAAQIPPSSGLPASTDAGVAAPSAPVVIVDAGTTTGQPEPPIDAGAPSSPEAAVDAGGASAAPTCTPGNFNGAFDGKIALSSSSSLLLSGSLELTLSLSVDGQSLQVTRGAVTATGPGGVPLRASITGYVDCATGQLKDGKLSGSYGQDGSSQQLPFAGDATGQYANQPGSLDGNWTASVPGSTVQAMGTFAGKRAP